MNMPSKYSSSLIAHIRIEQQELGLRKSEMHIIHSHGQNGASR